MILRIFLLLLILLFNLTNASEGLLLKKNTHIANSALEKKTELAKIVQDSININNTSSSLNANNLNDNSRTNPTIENHKLIKRSLDKNTQLVVGTSIMTFFIIIVSLARIYNPSI